MVSVSSEEREDDLAGDFVEGQHASSVMFRTERTRMLEAFDGHEVRAHGPAKVRAEQEVQGIGGPLGASSSIDHPAVGDRPVLEVVAEETLRAVEAEQRAVGSAAACAPARVGADPHVAVVALSDLLCDGARSVAQRRGEERGQEYEGDGARSHAAKCLVSHRLTPAILQGRLQD